MLVLWTKRASADLTEIADYLFERTPQHTTRLVETIYESASSLVTFPLRGRPGRVRGTRELVLAPLPYILIYSVTGETVHIVRILHGAQKWPE
jgi:addiction module RelE/StbE family toxin